MKPKLSDFDYKLPQALIAQYPATLRESSRMLVLDRKTGDISHKHFTDLADYIKREDVLTLNDTKVINARLRGHRQTGGKTEILLIERFDKCRFKALIKPSARIKEGDEITFEGSPIKASIVTKKAGGNVVIFTPETDNLYEELDRIGEIPLPPYIKRNVELSDRGRYQTVFAAKEGAAAAPTAGLHFTKDILKRMKVKGTGLAFVTLHVNYGTFAPVKSENISEHRMHEESFELSKGAADKINRTKAKGGRIFAVGTTSCRVIESCAIRVKGQGSRGQWRVKARRGRTDLFIYPPYQFKVADALLTNFHLPKSTLLMLVSAFAGDVSNGRYASADRSAFAGKELIFQAYREAIAAKYRFYSYGDCMLIL